MHIADFFKLTALLVPGGLFVGVACDEQSFPEGGFCEIRNDCDGDYECCYPTEDAVSVAGTCHAKCGCETDADCAGFFGATAEEGYGLPVCCEGRCRGAVLEPEDGSKPCRVESDCLAGQTCESAGEGACHGVCTGEPIGGSGGAGGGGGSGAAGGSGGAGGAPEGVLPHSIVAGEATTDAEGCVVVAGGEVSTVLLFEVLLEGPTGIFLRGTLAPVEGGVGISVSSLVQLCTGTESDGFGGCYRSRLSYNTVTDEGAVSILGPDLDEAAKASWTPAQPEHEFEMIVETDPDGQTHQVSLSIDGVAVDTITAENLGAVSDNAISLLMNEARLCTLGLL